MPPSPWAAATSHPRLAVRGVRRSFGDVEVLHDVSLSVRAGEIRAVLGENGAGKSGSGEQREAVAQWSGHRVAEVISSAGSGDELEEVLDTVRNTLCFHIVSDAHAPSPVEAAR